MTADGKYSCYKDEKCGHAMQMEWSKKRKICDQFFAAFLESTSIFQHFEKNDGAYHSTLSDIIDCEKSCYLNVLKAMF